MSTETTRLIRDGRRKKRAKISVSSLLQFLFVFVLSIKLMLVTSFM